MYKIGVLGSGVPLTFKYIQAAIQKGIIPNSEFAVVASNHSDVPLFVAAAQFGIPSIYLDGATPPEIDAQAFAAFQKHQVDFIILIGYGKLIGPALLEAYHDRILNIHSAPLPRFGGPGMVQPHTQQVVLDAGVQYSGPTIHLVDAQYDHGQILAHWPVKIRPGDTAESLNNRCNLAGQPLYVQAIKDFVHRLDHPDEF